MIGTMWNDVRYSIRAMSRTPVVAVAITITLALGIGLNGAMFSVLDPLYLRFPAGVVTPDGVRRVWQQTTFAAGQRLWPGFNHSSYRSIKGALQGYAAATIYSYPRRVRLGLGDDDQTASASYVEAGYFDMLGVSAERGRFFTDKEDHIGSPANVAIVSDAFWRTRLATAGDIIGRTLTLDGVPYMVVGVAGASFSGVDLDAADVWLPLAAYGVVASRWWDNRNVNGFQVLVRAHPLVSIDQIVARLRTALGRLEAPAMPGTDPLRAATPVVQLGSIIRARGPGEPDQESRIASRLGGVAALVLLIAIANVVNLVLMRAVQRRRDLAVRQALGASRYRVARLLVIECLLLSIAAGAAALIAAAWSGAVLRGFLFPDVHFAATNSWRLSILALVLSLAAGLVAGIIPAVPSSRLDVTRVLKAGAREGSVLLSRLGAAMVVVQTSLAVILLVGAALFLKSLSNVRALRIGYDTERLLFAEVRLDTRDPSQHVRVGTVMRSLADRLRRIPAVEQAAVTSLQPMRGFALHPYFPEADTNARKLPPASFAAVSPEFFGTTGMRLLRGSGFAHNAQPEQTVVINEALADAVWPGQDPVGRCMRFSTAGAACYTISGVVETARRTRVIEEPAAEYYLPTDRMPFPWRSASTLVVRADPAMKALVIAEIQREIRSAFPGGQPVVTAMSEALEPQYRPWRLGAVLFAAFGSLALLVAVLGVFSTLSYGVSVRMHEFGIRLALGASPRGLLLHVLGGAVRLAGVGVIVGTVLAMGGGRLVASLLFNVSPASLPVLLGTAAAVIATATLGALRPAWRAARSNAALALRSD